MAQNPLVTKIPADPADFGFRRSAAYAALFVLVFLIAVMAEDWAADSSGHLHGSLAVVNTVLGSLAGIGAWFLYDAKKNAQFLWIGLGFVLSAFCDGYFSVLTAHPAGPAGAQVARAAEWAWIGSRFALSVFLAVSFWGKVRSRRPEWMRRGWLEAVTVAAGVIGAGAAFWAVGSMFSEGGAEPVAACFFLAATLLYFAKGEWRTEPFDHWLLIGLLFLYWGEMFRWIFPVERFFGADPLTHLFKTAGYFSVEVGFLATLHELHRRLERESRLLEETTAKVQKTNRDLEDFTKTVSHDLKAPLRAIRAYAEQVRSSEKGRLVLGSEELLGRMTESAARMEKKIDDLLKESKAALVSDSRETVDLGDLVRQACEPLEEEIRQAGAHIRVQQPALPIRCVRIQMLTAMQNLIQNAVKYSRAAEGHKSRIEVGAQDCGTEYRIWVQDNGVGVAPEHAARIFEPFERAEAGETRTEGTGLGLFFVKKVAESHGGRCWVESEPGKGAKFVMTLVKNVERRPE